METIVDLIIKKVTDNSGEQEVEILDVELQDSEVHTTSLVFGHKLLMLDSMKAKSGAGAIRVRESLEEITDETVKKAAELGSSDSFVRQDREIWFHFPTVASIDSFIDTLTSLKEAIQTTEIDD